MGWYFGGIYSGVSGEVGYIQKHFRVGIFMGLYMDGAYIRGGGRVGMVGLYSEFTVRLLKIK